jgi:hypothetical protein
MLGAQPKRASAAITSLLTAPSDFRNPVIDLKGKFQMLTEKSGTFFSQTVDLDDKRFISCKFTNCTLRYKGGQFEWDEHTSFIGCRWDFLDAAYRTIKVLNISTSDPTDFNWANTPFRSL